jgi:hypothetical protein
MALSLPPTCEAPPNLVRPAASRKAVAGLVFGLLSFLLGIVASLPAFFFAARGLTEVERDPRRVRGRRLALAGIFTAGLGMFFQPLALLLAVQLVRDRVARQTDAANLEHIGAAMYQYHDRAGRLPPAASRAPNGRALLSWRVALLPHLGHGELYAKFHHDEPWDSPHNYALVRRMPKVFAHPSDPGAAAKGLTYYRVLVGEGTPFNDRKGPRIPTDFPNGAGMFLVVAAPHPVPWTEPNELLYEPIRPPPKLGGLLRGGSNVLYANGSAGFLADDADEKILRPAMDVRWEDLDAPVGRGRQ